MLFGPETICLTEKHYCSLGHILGKDVDHQLDHASSRKLQLCDNTTSFQGQVSLGPSKNSKNLDFLWFSGSCSHHVDTGYMQTWGKGPVAISPHACTLVYSTRSHSPACILLFLFFNLCSYNTIFRIHNYLESNPCLF